MNNDINSIRAHALDLLQGLEEDDGYDGPIFNVKEKLAVNGVLRPKTALQIQRIFGVSKHTALTLLDEFSSGYEGVGCG